MIKSRFKYHTTQGTFSLIVIAIWVPHNQLNYQPTAPRSTRSDSLADSVHVKENSIHHPVTQHIVKVMPSKPVHLSWSWVSTNAPQFPSRLVIRGRGKARSKLKQVILGDIQTPIGPLKIRGRGGMVPWG
jgi:hypothetical protein